MDLESGGFGSPAGEGSHVLCSRAEGSDAAGLVGARSKQVVARAPRSDCGCQTDGVAGVDGQAVKAVQGDGQIPPGKG
jgi:hypothetical protein